LVQDGEIRMRILSWSLVEHLLFLSAV